MIMKKIIILSFVLLVATSLCVQQEVDQYEDSCNPEWVCGDWSEKCIHSEFTRTCQDMNNCNTTEGKPSETKECVVETNITKLEFLLLTAKDTDYDYAGTEGFEFIMAPKTSSGSLIKQTGTVSVKLWEREYEDNQVVKGDLIDEWDGTEVNSEDYGYTGIYVSFTFDEDYNPDPKDYGVLEVTLITEEGAEITSVKEDFLIGRQIFY